MNNLDSELFRIKQDVYNSKSIEGSKFDNVNHNLTNCKQKIDISSHYSKDKGHPECFEVTYITGSKTRKTTTIEHKEIISNSTNTITNINQLSDYRLIKTIVSVIYILESWSDIIFIRIDNYKLLSAKYINSGWEYYSTDKEEVK